MSTNINGDPNPGEWVPPPKGYALSGKIMLTAIVVLFTAVLLILFLHLYLRWRGLRLTSSGRRRRRRLVFAGEDRSFPSPADRGLAADVLKSLPVFVFNVRGGGDGDEVVECAVCLAEFQEGEKVRSLPPCGHRFHIECIDMWFRSHATCPLCRIAVEAVPPPVNSTISVQVSALEPLEAAAAAERSTSASDLCSRCGGEEGIGSSSANLGDTELRIEVPARRGEGFRGPEEELGLGWGLSSPGGQGMKSPGSRILLLRRILSRDLKLYRGGSSAAAPDLERGEGAERSSPPPPPPPAAAV